jgi:hypothetical protein
VILVRLQVLKVVQAILRFHQDRKLILAIVILEVLFTAIQDVVYAFKGYCQHFHILKFEDRA